MLRTSADHVLWRRLHCSVGLRSIACTCGQCRQSNCARAKARGISGGRQARHSRQPFARMPCGMPSSVTHSGLCCSVVLSLGRSAQASRFVCRPPMIFEEKNTVPSKIRRWSTVNLVDHKGTFCSENPKSIITALLHRTCIGLRSHHKKLS